MPGYRHAAYYRCHFTPGHTIIERVEYVAFVHC